MDNVRHIITPAEAARGMRYMDVETGPVGMGIGCEPEINEMDQEAANYLVTGGDSTKCCATCQWFSSPDDCNLVEDEPDPIVPQGVCDLWRQRQRPKQMPMMMSPGDIARGRHLRGDGLLGERQDGR